MPAVVLSLTEQKSNNSIRHEIAAVAFGFLLRWRLRRTCLRNDSVGDGRGGIIDRVDKDMSTAERCSQASADERKELAEARFVQVLK